MENNALGIDAKLKLAFSRQHKTLKEGTCKSEQF